MPSGVVDYFKGERFAYTDYAIGSVLRLLQDEGCDNIGVYYDIYCHWSRNFWTRAKLLPAPVTEPEHFIGGIGKYHLAGHTDTCYALYSLNNMPGVGRMDAEGCERLWADANHASGSTANKGSGARTNSLNYLFQDWNWRKIVGTAPLLDQKLKEALHMSVEQRAEWQAFNDCLDSELTKEWEVLDTKPSKDEKGVLRSVYLLEEHKGLSVTKSLQELRALEAADQKLSKSAPSLFSPSDWIAEGLEIERIQQRLRVDIKSNGSTPTPAQSLDIGRRRQALQSRLTRHTNDASLFYSATQLANHVVSASLNDDPAIQGRQEQMKLAMPSRLPMFGQQSARAENLPLIELEQNLRRACCFESLARVRTTSQQKALLLRHKQKHVRGEVKNTRIQGMISRLTARVELAVWEYENSRLALLFLEPDDADKNRLRSLSKSDLSGLMSMLNADRSTGQGYKNPPWFWGVRSMATGDDDDSERELEAALKVEWFRSKARYERWEEEVEILRREMASVLFSFQREVDTWVKRISSNQASFFPGYQSYCYQQAAMWESLQAHAAKKFSKYLQDPMVQNTTCRRAAAQFL